MLAGRGSTQPQVPPPPSNHDPTLLYSCLALQAVACLRQKKVGDTAKQLNNLLSCETAVPSGKAQVRTRARWSGTAPWFARGV